MAGVANDLGQTIIPSVFASLYAAGIMDTMTVYGESAASDSAGGVRRTQTTVYSNVPVTYKPSTVNGRLIKGDRVQSENEYTLIFPTHDANASRYNIDPKAHRFVVNARGNEPAKTFRIISTPDVIGIVYKAICVKEN